jgi:sugar/nucleoside kinase (ribokinase family)
VGKDFKGEHKALLESRNVDVRGLQVLDGRTFRWKGSYGYDLNDAKTLDTQLNVFSDFSPEIPAAYREAEFVFLGNIAPELQQKVVTQVKSPRVVACDTMNYWIEGSFESLVETLRSVDLLVINDAETRQLAQEPNLVKAARKILNWGPSALVVKRGEYGVLKFALDGRNDLDVFGAPAYPLEDVFDPTGAGDSFAGGLMGYLAGTGRYDDQAIRQAIIFGSVMASFNVEKFSVERLKELTFAEVELRYREFRKLTQFDDVTEFERS